MSNYEEENNIDGIEQQQQSVRKNDSSKNRKILDQVNRLDEETGQPWHASATFSCYQCHATVESVENSIYHMTTFHPDSVAKLASENQNQNQHTTLCACILCPKLLAKMDHLMIHLWRHLKKTAKETTKKSWVESQYWKCKTCQQEYQGLKAFCDHLNEVHHLIEELRCPSCDKNDFSNR
jgi:hypothetical protein